MVFGFHDTGSGLDPVTVSLAGEGKQGDKVSNNIWKEFDIEITTCRNTIQSAGGRQMFRHTFFSG